MSSYVIRHVCEAMNILPPYLQHTPASPPPYILAIDGRCGSGKTSLAMLLSEQLHCPVIHMDDFFLPPSMRTQERLSQPGGNVHRERLIEEVLLPLKQGVPFSYRPFDCSISDFGVPVDISPSPLVVVEGSYACHPDLREFYNMTVFMTISYELQMSRILSRNGQEKALAFQNKWIPLEETYFQFFDVQSTCDVLFEMI